MNTTAAIWHYLYYSNKNIYRLYIIKRSDNIDTMGQLSNSSILLCPQSIYYVFLSYILK